MKKALGVAIPFLITHLICCGGLLFFLVTSGYLLLLYNESQNKIFLLPALILLGLSAWQLPKIENRYLRLTLYILIYALTSYLFIVYLFIPWWIPGYRGGPLLP